MPSPTIDLTTMVLAISGGAIAFVAFGVDFPESRWRFSRLA